MMFESLTLTLFCLEKTSVRKNCKVLAVFSAIFFYSKVSVIRHGCYLLLSKACEREHFSICSIIHNEFSNFLCFAFYFAHLRAITYNCNCND